MIDLETLEISEAHKLALQVIMSEAYPFADDRNIGPVLEEFIEDYLLREDGRLGRIVNGQYKTINQR